MVLKAYHPTPFEIEQVIENLEYPVLVSPKLDGIRARRHGFNFLSRTDKPIPNNYIRTKCVSKIPPGVEGELIAGSTFNETTSNVMRKDDHVCSFHFYAFDLILPNVDFIERLERLNKIETNEYWSILPQMFVCSAETLLKVEQDFLAESYPYGEGIVVRSPKGRYEFNKRSTLKSQNFIAIKRRESDFAKIIGFTALKRATAQDDRTSAQTVEELGNIVCSFQGFEFEIGSGFNQQQRVMFWKDREALLGKYCRFTHLPVGRKTLPRQPVFHELIDNVPTSV